MSTRHRDCASALGIRSRVTIGMTLLALVCACDGGGSGSSGGIGEKARLESDARAECANRPIRMAVAASLRSVAIDLVEDLEAHQPSLRIITSFGASSALARQIEFGAPVDILLSADEEIIFSLNRKGLMKSESVFEIARGQLVVATRSGSPVDGLGLRAFDSDSLQRFGLPSAAVPLGRYGRAWLEGRGFLDDLEDKIVITEHARATLTALVQGHVDLAILYETDLRLRESLHVLHRALPGSHPPIRYVAGLVSEATSCPQVEIVLQSWRSAQARERLLNAGFSMKPTTPSSKPKSRQGLN